MPPLASPFLNPIPPFFRWLGALTMQTVVGSPKGGGSVSEPGGSNVAPSGNGVHVDQYA